MTKKRNYTPRPLTRETDVYGGPIVRTPTKKNSLGDSVLIYDDDGTTPFTGWKRVPAKGWLGARTSVLKWIQDGEISAPGFNTPTDATPFSMGGWQSYKDFWRPVVETSKLALEKYKDYHDLRRDVLKWTVDQTIKLPSLTDRLTPSDQPGKSLYDEKQEQKQHLDIQSQYKIPSSIKVSDEIRLDNVEK